MSNSNMDKYMYNGKVKYHGYASIPQMIKKLKSSNKIHKW